MLGVWHFQNMPWIELRSYKCTEGHLFFDEAFNQGDPEPHCCFRSKCPGALRRIRDAEKPPRLIKPF